MKLDKLMEKKKKDKPMSDMAKEAKMSVVKEMQAMAAGAMKDGLKGGLKKVTVASDSPEGLKEGLDKAKQIADGISGDDTDQADTDLEDAREDEPIHSPEGYKQAKEDSKEMMGYSGEEEGEEDEMEDCSEEELDAKLAKLMDLKKKMQAKKA
tara:strand:+ start:3846 stop:4304 length:459 start_codon:yes stop_codon:yes gene_type:complete